MYIHVHNITYMYVYTNVQCVVCTYVRMYVGMYIHSADFHWLKVHEYNHGCTYICTGTC